LSFIRKMFHYRTCINDSITSGFGDGVTWLIKNRLIIKLI
jgi:hypothetical protein